MIPVTLNRHTVKLSQNEAREAQRFYSFKQRDELYQSELRFWINNAPNEASRERRKDAVKKFNL